MGDYMTDTGGGAYVGGDANAGKNLIGRDHIGRDRSDYSHDSNINIKLGDDHDLQRKSRLSLDQRLSDLERYVYGDMRSGEPGLIKQAKIQLRWSQATFTLSLIMIVVVVLARFVT